MNKIIKDEKIIDELLNRSVAEILPSKEEFKKLLMSGKRIRFYIGTDATGTSLHLGHATNYIILEKLRKLGHEAIILIGDFTARIGDPSDKSSVRQQLSREQVLEHVKTWRKQLEKVINFDDPNNPVIIKYNHDWLASLTFEEIINISSNFTVQRMMERDMFQKRLKEDKPIYLHEFFYPLMQGYDSVAMDVDMELCGNDQKFNALAGRTLLKKLKNKEKFVMITTLLENPITHEKMMSKSLGTGIFLDETPENMYGKTMAQPDENMIQLFTDCTYLSLAEIETIKAGLKSGSINPRDLKMRLAYEITKIYHGADIAQAAQENFIKTVQNKEIPEDLPEFKMAAGSYKIIDLLIETKLAASRGEAKRLIEQKGIKAADKIIGNAEETIKLEKEIILQRGKRQFVKIIVK